MLWMFKAIILFFSTIFFNGLSLSPFNIMVISMPIRQTSRITTIRLKFSANIAVLFWHMDKPKMSILHLAMVKTAITSTRILGRYKFEMGAVFTAIMGTFKFINGWIYGHKKQP